MPSRSLLWPTVATALVMAVLLGLGFWQLQRLQWKLGLIQRISERVHAAPVAVEAVLHQDAAADIGYTHVTATGHFRHDLERYLYANGENDWGWDVLTPLELASGETIIVNRGYIPHQLQDRAARAAGLPEGAASIAGLVRLTPSGRPWSIPAGDAAKGTWYWPEIPAIAASMYPSGGKPVTAIYVDADPVAATAPPVGGATNLELPNRHLEYAYTWFGLAAALAVIYGLFAFPRLAGSRG